MTNKILTVIIVVAVICFGLGYFVAIQVKLPAKLNQIIGGQNTFQAGWDAAKKRLAETGFLLIPMAANMEIKTVSGEITAINDSKVALKIRPLEPLADPALDNRVVTIDNATKVYQLVVKDQQTYQKEMAEYIQKMQAQTDQRKPPIQPLTPPEYYTKKEIKITDLKTGQQITVTADKDIKNAREFKAVEITLQIAAGAAVLPAPVPVAIPR